MGLSLIGGMDAAVTWWKAPMFVQMLLSLYLGFFILGRREGRRFKIGIGRGVR